jgi:hypothetical protein
VRRGTLQTIAAESSEVTFTYEVRKADGSIRIAASTPAAYGLKRSKIVLPAPQVQSKLDASGKLPWDATGIKIRLPVNEVELQGRLTLRAWASNAPFETFFEAQGDAGKSIEVDTFEVDGDDLIKDNEGAVIRIWYEGQMDDAKVISPVVQLWIAGVPAPPKPLPLIMGEDYVMHAEAFCAIYGKLPAAPPESATYTRVAVGGTPPYTYQSNSASLFVDGSGRIVPTFNGLYRVTATDAVGERASFMIYVNGVTQFHLWVNHPGQPAFPARPCTNWSISKATARLEPFDYCRLPTIAEFRSLWKAYYVKGAKLGDLFHPSVPIDIAWAIDTDQNEMALAFDLNGDDIDGNERHLSKAAQAWAVFIFGPGVWDWYYGISSTQKGAAGVASARASGSVVI